MLNNHFFASLVIGFNIDVNCKEVAKRFALFHKLNDRKKQQKRKIKEVGC